MKTRIFLFGSLILAFVAILLTVEPTVASNNIARTEELACTSCHDKPGSKLLTDRGKYYEAMGTVEGYEALTERFSRCTSCHVRKPGSPKMTQTGRKYQWMLQDMNGLREWLMDQHPVRPSAYDEELEGTPESDSDGR